jgi:hypothetical protein
MHGVRRSSIEKAAGVRHRTAMVVAVKRKVVLAPAKKRGEESLRVTVLLSNLLKTMTAD